MSGGDLYVYAMIAIAVLVIGSMLLDDPTAIWLVVAVAAIAYLLLGVCLGWNNWRRDRQSK
jgi:hydrogenase/urease accessory protein HupE